MSESPVMIAAGAGCRVTPPLLFTAKQRPSDSTDLIASERALYGQGGHPALDTAPARHMRTVANMVPAHCGESQYPPPSGFFDAVMERVSAFSSTITAPGLCIIEISARFYRDKTTLGIARADFPNMTVEHLESSEGVVRTNKVSPDYPASESSSRLHWWEPHDLRRIHATSETPSNRADGDGT